MTADPPAAVARPPTLTWRWARFDELTTAELYAILVLRGEIFVVEQNCAFLDPDGADSSSLHLLGHVDDEPRWLGAYLRLVDAGVKYAEPSIGRVVVSARLRGLGCGRMLMEEGLTRASALLPGCDIVIGAQQRLERFYHSLGFVVEGPLYVEDGIDHVKMRMRAT